MLEDWIKAEEAKKIGEGADAKSIAEHIKFWLGEYLKGWGWGTPKDIAGLWCTLPEFVRSRPYIEETFREKMRKSAADKWECFGQCPGANWSWDVKFTCAVTPSGGSKNIQSSALRRSGLYEGAPKQSAAFVKAPRVQMPTAAPTTPSMMQQYAIPVIPVKAGLSTAAKAGIGVGVLAAVGVGAWMFMRK